MSEGQWMGVLFLVGGVYLVVCSTWARSFILYRFKAERAADMIGDGAAHWLYRVLGMVLIICGALQALQIWVV